jgi:peptidyl-prolyl cis-trans isomerase B (cyclophilin B)
MKHFKNLSAVALTAGLLAFNVGCDGGSVENEAPEEPVQETGALDTTADVSLASAQMRTERKTYDAPPAMQIDPAGDYTATLKTNRGDITVELFAADAPKTVNNFVFLANEGFYDGIIFHRVIKGFMIQGGDPTGTGSGGPGYRFEDEVRGNPQTHEPFTLSMANAGPNTNGSQFFITEVATPFLDDKHTVFGRVIDGQDVVLDIANTRTAAGDRPIEPVVINTIEIESDAPASTQPTTAPGN